MEKALRATKLPKGFFSGEDGEDSGTALAERDQKFSKALLQIQNSYAEGLVDLCVCILAHAGFMVDRLEVNVTIEKPTRLSKNLLEGYKNVVDFIDSLKGVLQGDKTNVNFPTTNLAQLLALAGLPLDFIKLLLAQNPVNVLDDSTLQYLFSGMEVEIYNYNRSKLRAADIASNATRDELGQLIVPEDMKAKDEEEPSDGEEEDMDAGGGGIEPDHYKVSSVSNSKQLSMFENYYRKVIVRRSSVEALATQPALKKELLEVASDLRGKKSLNG